MHRTPLCAEMRRKAMVDFFGHVYVWVVHVYTFIHVFIGEGT